MTELLLFSLDLMLMSALLGTQVCVNGNSFDIQPRRRSCRNLGGQCVSSQRTCPEHLLLEKDLGAPFCYKKRRCCYPAVISHEDFLSKFNKTYTNKEESKKRREIFQGNIERMEEHNKLYVSGNSSFIMGVNEYSDMTYEEVVSELTGEKEQPELSDTMRAATSVYIPTDIGNEPISIDYRDMGAINKIRNQRKGKRNCGSCWAFSAVGSIESQIYLKYEDLVQLSEQYLIDCSKGYAFPGPTGCAGGWTNRAIKYVLNNGIAPRDVYPYTAKGGGMCNEQAPQILYKVTGIQRINKYNDTELMNALVHRGPLSVSIWVTRNFKDYKSGVLEDELCDNVKKTNHAMVLVGYGTNLRGKDYWIVRNSWGDSWGREGYYKLARNTRNHCQISSRAYIPIVALVQHE